MTIRSIQAFRIGGAWNMRRQRLLYVIFEQGIFYFSVVTLFTTAAVVLNSAGFPRRLLNALLLPLSGLLTARFLLQLRAWEHKQSALVTGSDRRTVSNAIPPIEFRVLSVIDDFGEDLVLAAERRQSEEKFYMYTHAVLDLVSVITVHRCRTYETTGRQDLSDPDKITIQGNTKITRILDNLVTHHHQSAFFAFLIIPVQRDPLIRHLPSCEPIRRPRLVLGIGVWPAYNLGFQVSIRLQGRRWLRCYSYEGQQAGRGL
ncbi:hypothetical protein IW262DRAFT_1122811 [Armillaria fumosa]|nr:hypothetical protein IW262DRAFT_1122811 [Armillaria fumosa]